MANDSRSGGRQLVLNRKREEEKKQQEEERAQIKKDNTVKISTMDQQYVSRSDTVDDVLVRSTVGLVTLDQYKQKKEMIESLQEVEQRKEERRKNDQMAGQKKKKKKRKISTNKLSFADDFDQDEEADADVPEKPRLGKNPDVDTTFLPDRERIEEERLARQEFKGKWMAEQSRLKEIPINITYSYWDGRGHRKDVEMQQGNTIETFLRAVSQEFPELRGTPADDLMYIKEDLIIPQSFTFYDLIVTKARGKSGPLFNFDVHDDIRAVMDVRVEKNESHAGKVVERRWYERNKHIFPASRWEVFDPQKDYGSYTIHGGEVNGRKPGVIGADL